MLAPPWPAGTTRAVTESTLDSPDSDSVDPAPPAGVSLSYPANAIVLITVRIATRTLALLAVPRILLLLASLAIVVFSWQHHIFFFFWLFGLPFLRWLRGGPRQTSVLVQERELVIQHGHWLGGPLIVPRGEIASLGIGHAGFAHLHQRAIVVKLRDARTGYLFVGLDAAQAEFVSQGLTRWLRRDY